MNNRGAVSYSDYSVQQLYEEYLILKENTDNYNSHQVVYELRNRLKIPHTADLSDIELKSHYNRHLQSTVIYAGRIDRLLAYLFDIFIILIPCFLALLFRGPDGLKNLFSNDNFEQTFIIFLTGQVLYLIINWRLLIRKGQTIGKKILNIKIINSDGRPPFFTQIYGLRYLIPSLIYLIPFAGLVISAINFLFIFRNDRRCLHDIIADTRVIKAA